MSRRFLSFQPDMEQNEASGSHRWMISYADFITLLFVLFLVLYAKLPKQNDVNTTKVQPAHGQMIPGIRPRHVQMPIQAQAATPARSRQKQQVVWQDLTHTLSDLQQAGDIRLTEREDGVLLDIRDSALFASGTAQPAAQASSVLAKIADVLKKDDSSVVVEGHTDSVPIQTAQFPSNWELSSARAASVVRALQEYGVRADRMTASGLAETRPRSGNDTPQGRSENRRVSLLVLSSS
jgi:chemotaxis protein MotB